ncbi:hypothetical protein HDU82_005995 [Entophlyctis luteolus]|nr:hypothetical protein HDU82_005995 [Entophlyctis luteolus]
MDVSTLVAFLSEDIAVGRRPCVVFARACGETGTVSGEWDNLLCSDSMSLLSMSVSLDKGIPETAKKIESLRSADSVTFLPAVAFKLSNPYELTPVTFFNAVDPRVIDPLHLDLFDSTASDKNMSSVPSAHRRKSGGSAGGALIAATLRPSTEREPPKHVSHVPPSKRSHAPTFVPKPSPWTPGFGTPESLRALEESRKEAWNNKLNADLGTRVVTIEFFSIPYPINEKMQIFENISKHIKDGLGLELDNFSGVSYIKYKSMSYSSQSQSHETLVNALIEELPALAHAVTSTLRHQKTLQSVIESLPSRPVELRYLLPSHCSASTELGLGGIHFSPTYLDVETVPLDPQVVCDLDALNTCLANELGGVFTKAAIKKSENGFGLDAIGVCVWVGLDRNGYDEEKIGKLVDSLLRKGRELERSEQFLATLSEVVKRGIHEAEINLKKKHVPQEETSILHSLPMIGTVLNLIGAIPPAAQHSFLNDLAPQLNRLTSHNFTLSRGYSTVEVDIDHEKSPIRAPIAEDMPPKLLENGSSADESGETDSTGSNLFSGKFFPQMREFSDLHLNDFVKDGLK